MPSNLMQFASVTIHCRAACAGNTDTDTLWVAASTAGSAESSTQPGAAADDAINATMGTTTERNLPATVMSRTSACGGAQTAKHMPFARPCLLRRLSRREVPPRSVHAVLQP